MEDLDVEMEDGRARFNKFVGEGSTPPSESEIPPQFSPRNEWASMFANIGSGEDEKKKDSTHVSRPRRSRPIDVETENRNGWNKRRRHDSPRYHKWNDQETSSMTRLNVGRPKSVVRHTNRPMFDGDIFNILKAHQSKPPISEFDNNWYHFRVCPNENYQFYNLLMEIAKYIRHTYFLTHYDAKYLEVYINLYDNHNLVINFGVTRHIQTLEDHKFILGSIINTFGMLKQRRMKRN